MLQRIKVNMDVMETMLYFWQATSDKDKVSEKYLNDLAKMPGLSYTYDDEFNAESVRKVLSAITNREPFASKIKKESRFWNNNMWMLEDPAYTDSIIQPLKKLNLDHLVDEINKAVPAGRYEDVEVFFSPLHLEDCYEVENKLIINFFMIIPDLEGNLKVGELPLVGYIKEKILELMAK
jgi:hypothetical protein